MAVELGSGYFGLFPKIAPGSVAKATSEMEDDLERAGRSAGDRAGEGFGGTFGAGIKKAVGLATAAFAGFAAVDFLKGAIGAASDLGEVTSKSAQIFGSEALPALEKFADGASTALGQSKTQALNAAATFATFGKSAGLTGPELVDFSTQLVTLSGDMASFGNTTPEQAIEAVGAALRGESEPIRSYGVLLDDATLKNRALKLGIISSTKEALTPANKVLAAQAEILAQTSDTQGDFARTSGGLANQQRILAAQVENAKVKLGEAFLPVVTKVMTFINTTAITGLQSFAGSIKDLVVPAFGALKQGLSGEGVTSDGFLGLMQTVGGKILELKDNIGLAAGAFRGAFSEGDITSTGWVGVVEAVGRTLGDFVRFLRTDVLGALKDFADGFRSAGDEVGKADLEGKFEGVGRKVGELVKLFKDNPDVFQPVVAALAGMAGALVALKAASAGASVLSTLGSSIGGIASLLPILISPLGIAVILIGGLAAAAVLAYKKIGPFRDAVDSVVRVFKDEGFAGAITEAGLQFGRLWDLAQPKLVEFGTNLVAFLREKAPEWASAFFAWVTETAVPWVAVRLGELSAAIGGWITGTAVPYLAGKAAEWAGALSGWITETALPAAVAKLGEWKDALGDWIDNTAIPYLQEKSPEWGHALVDWILDDALPFMITKSADLFVWFQDWITGTVWPWLADKGPEWTKALLEWIVTGAIPYTTEKMGQLMGIITGFVLGAIASLASHAAEWVASVLGWIQDAITQAPGELAGLASTIETGVTSGFGDIATWLYDAGRDLIEGMVNGVKSKAGDLVSAAKSVVSGAVDAAKGVLGIKSPSKVFHEIGVWSMEGLTAGVGAESGTVQQAVVNVAASMPTALNVGSLRDDLHAVDWGTGNAPGADRPQAIQLVVDGRVLAEAVARRQRALR